VKLGCFEGKHGIALPARAWRTLALALIGCATAAPGLGLAAPHDLSVAAEQHLLDQYCRVCHNFDDWAGGVDFETFDPSQPWLDPRLTERMLRKLRAGMMPPVGKPRPDIATVRVFATNLEQEIDSHAKPNLAMPRLHRMNRTEYQNAVRDLLGLDVDASSLLPTDDSSHGFDNQAGTLTLSPALLEAYLSAAARISRVAIGTETSPTQVTYAVAADTTQNYHVEGLPFGTRGGLLIRHEFPADGTYTFKIYSVNLGNMGNFRPFGDIRGEQLLIYLDDKRVAQVDWDRALHVTRMFDADPDQVQADPQAGQLRTIDVTLPITAGPHRVGVTFLATDYAPGLDMNRHFDRSTIETGGIPGFTFYPHIGRVRIDGPAHATTAKDTPSRARIFLCHPAQPSNEQSCAHQIAAALARRAYRGFATPADIDALMHFYALGRQDGSFDEGVEALVQRALADPKFIFRVESAPQGLAPGTPYAVSDRDLASRLSFFLWSSIPDEELLRHADQGDLHQDGVLQAQIRRMLADPRAAALATNFADQWLGLRALTAFDPVVDRYPDFDDNLRQAMRREVELLFGSFIQENRSVLDLLTVKYTFINERLAMLYGIPGVKGSYFRRVVLDDSLSDRWGLLGKGAILAITSHPDRTSPVVRGNWVLRTLLGSPAPDPPPVVPVLMTKPVDPAGNTRPPTMREQFNQHHANPTCASCHRIMEPIGFALEPFDAIGRWRAEDNGSPIDTHSIAYDGTTIDGTAGVRAFLLRYQEQYLRNVVENLMTYARGRGIEYDDMPTVRRILHETSGNGYGLRSLIEAIAMSDVFRMNVTSGPSGLKVASSGTTTEGSATTSEGSAGTGGN
jgi:hypothetical protein